MLDRCRFNSNYKTISISLMDFRIDSNPTDRYSKLYTTSYNTFFVIEDNTAKQILEAKNTYYRSGCCGSPLISIIVLDDEREFSPSFNTKIVTEKLKFGGISSFSNNKKSLNKKILLV